MIEFKIISHNIYAVEASTTQELAKMFLRFQEHYESPKFRDRIFTLSEFKSWYKTNRDSKKFTYYDDWVGFNVPSTVIDKFIKGRFDPLSSSEKWLLNQIKKEHRTKKPYYVIGYQKSSKPTIRHEMAHARFYTDVIYQNRAVLGMAKILSIENFKKICNHLREMGYHKSVCVDEVHAYALCEKTYLKAHKLWNKNVEKYSKYLNRLLDEREEKDGLMQALRSTTSSIKDKQ